MLYCRVVFFSSPNERKSLENEREGLSAHKKNKKKQNSQGSHLPLTLSVFAFCLGIESTRKTKVLFAVFGFGEGVVGLSWVSLVFLVRSRVSRSNSSLCASFVLISVRVLRLTKKDNRKKERRKEGKKKKKKRKKQENEQWRFPIHLTSLDCVRLRPRSCQGEVSDAPFGCQAVNLALHFIIGKAKHFVKVLCEVFGRDPAQEELGQAAHTLIQSPRGNARLRSRSEWEKTQLQVD